MAIANNIQEDINDLVRKLRLVSDRAKTDSRSAFREAAKPLVAAIRAKAPVSKENHTMRGVEYRSGNLKRSIAAFTWKRSDAIFIGPRMTRNRDGGKMPDGWYAHLMEFEYGLGGKRPQPFIRPAAAQHGPAALQLATRTLAKKIDKYYALSISI